MYKYKVIRIDLNDRVRVLKTFDSKEEAIAYIENDCCGIRDNEFEVLNRIYDWYGYYDGCTYLIVMERL